MKRLLFGVLACFSIVFAGCSSSSSTGGGTPAATTAKGSGMGMGMGSGTATKADMLVGKWTGTKMVIAMTDAPYMPGKEPVWEFTKEKVKMTPPGAEATYKLDGDKISMTMGMDKKDSTIKTITADELVLSSEGAELYFKKTK